MENIKLLVVELDMEGTVKYVNSHFSKFTDYSTSEVIGSNWFNLMLEDHEKNEMLKTFSKIIHGGEVPTYQNLIKLKNGAKKSVQRSNIHLKNL